MRGKRETMQRCNRNTSKFLSVNLYGDHQTRCNKGYGFILESSNVKPMGFIPRINALTGHKSSICEPRSEEQLSRYF